MFLIRFDSFAGGQEVGQRENKAVKEASRGTHHRDVMSAGKMEII